MQMSQATCPRRALRLAAASVGVIALGGLGLSALTAAPQPDPLGEKTGGDTTVYATGRNAFSFPAANLPDDERMRFVTVPYTHLTPPTILCLNIQTHHDPQKPTNSSLHKRPIDISL